MISLFDTKPEGEETPMFRKVYLSRLHEIAHGSETEEAPDDIAQAAYATLTATETLQPEPAAAPVTPEQAPEPEPMPVLHLEQPADLPDKAVEVPQEGSREIAEQIAPKFVGAFTAMIDELHQRLSAPEDHISKAVDAVQVELASLRSAVESLANSQRDLAVHVSDIGARLRVHEQAYRNVETMVHESEQTLKFKQEELEKKLMSDSAQVAEINERLDAQASVIRKLYDVSRDRDTHRDELRSALLKIEEITTKLSPSDPLPEKL